MMMMLVYYFLSRKLTSPSSFSTFIADFSPVVGIIHCKNKLQGISLFVSLFRSSDVPIFYLFIMYDVPLGHKLFT